MRILVIYRDYNSARKTTSVDGDIVITRIDLTIYNSLLIRGHSFDAVFLRPDITIEELQSNENAWAALKNTLFTRCGSQPVVKQLTKFEEYDEKKINELDVA